MKSGLRLVCFLIILLLLSSCSKMKLVSEHPHKITQLQNEIRRWQTFQMSGVVEVSYKMFVFRKNFSIQKDREAIRIDLLDSGVFGLSASSISIFADSVLNISGHIGKTPLSFSVSEENKDLYRLLNQTDSNWWKDQEDSLLNSHSAMVKNWKIIFNQQMHLSEIINENEEISIRFFYSINQEPEKIIIKKNGAEICNIKIDKITYENISVQKLKR